MKLIQSRDNPFYKSLKRLAESGRERRKTGLTLLDGLHLVSAHESELGPVQSLFVAQSSLTSPEIGGYLAGRDYCVLSDALMRELGLVDTPSGLLAIVSIPTARFAVDYENDAVLLDGIQDPGNVGTLLRTAAAAGFKQVLLSAGCASAWAPKVLRSGQGAQFVLSIHEDVDFEHFFEVYRGQTAVTCLTDSRDLYQTDLTQPLAWVFGSEGQGVRPVLRQKADLKVLIPMPGAVESLNVAAAAAVCLFETLRQRM